MRAASSMSSQLLTGDLLVIICPMNFCLFSISCQLYESNVPSVTYRKIFTLSFMFPCLKIRPSCCSMSVGHFLRTVQYILSFLFLYPTFSLNSMSSQNPKSKNFLFFIIYNLIDTPIFPIIFRLQNFIIVITIIKI